MADPITYQDKNGHTEMVYSDCPVCGSPGVNMIGRNAVTTLRHTQNDNWRCQEGGLRIPMKGECCDCLFYICVGQHKGTMIIHLETTNKKVFEVGAVVDDHYVKERLHSNDEPRR